MTSFSPSWPYCPSKSSITGFKSRACLCLAREASWLDLLLHCCFHLHPDAKLAFSRRCGTLSGFDTATVEGYSVVSFSLYAFWAFKSIEIGRLICLFYFY